MSKSVPLGNLANFFPEIDGSTFRDVAIPGAEMKGVEDAVDITSGTQSVLTRSEETRSKLTHEQIGENNELLPQGLLISDVTIGDALPRKRYSDTICSARFQVSCE